MARTIQVTFDAHDPNRLAQFWCAVLGYEREHPPTEETWEEQLTAWGVPREEWNSRDAIVDPAGAGPRIYFQRVPEGKTAKNRVHLDVRAAVGLTGEERMAEFERQADELVALGATRVRRHDPDPATQEAGFLVMQDPEGNEFCLD